MKEWIDATAVGLGEFAVATDSGRITVRGLGSCVAVILHDATTNTGGVAHVVLPSHTLAREQVHPAKFADTAVPLLVRELEQLGARPDNLAAKLVGGARMFASLIAAGTVHMGERNVVACRTALRAAGLPLVAEDVGGEQSRSLLYDVADGTITVRTLGSARHV